MKNLGANDIMFSSNNLNSAYFFHTKDNLVEYLVIDMSIKINEFDQNLTRDQLEQVFQKLLHVLLNMKPKKNKTVEEFWMNDTNMSEIDIFQHREDLDGLCWACLLAKQP